MRTIRTNSNKEYKLLFDWKDFGICCNEDLVNKTAFFEVYPNNPNTYLRVEGKKLKRGNNIKKYLIALSMNLNEEIIKMVQDFVNIVVYLIVMLLNQ